MKHTRLVKMRKKSRSGYVLLVMLLFSVLLAVFISVRMNRGGPAIEMGVGLTDETSPWEEWRDMQGRIEEWRIGGPTDEQLELAKALVFNANLTKEGEDRGNIAMRLNHDGTIEGGWSGQFFVQPKVDHQVVGSVFKGNIDPEKLYYDEDEETEDPSQLYLLCKGSFKILETNDESGKVRIVNGDIYVNGWVDTEYTARGKVIVTSDSKHIKTFNWEAKGKESGAMPFNLFK